MIYAADIPFEVAERAHAGTSFAPERRAMSEITGYSDHLSRAHISLTNAAGPERRAEADAKFDRYRAYYRRLTLDYLQSRSGAMSTMITGAGNFPVRRMEKKWASVDGRLSRLTSQPQRLLAKMLRDLVPESDRPAVIGNASATSKLADRLSEMGARQAKMKETNAKWRKASPAVRITLQVYQPFELSNLSATIRRTRVQWERSVAADLRRQAAAATGDKEETIGGVRAVHNTADNRLQLFFPERPAPATITALKRSGWHWSGRNGCWQRQLTGNAIYSAREILIP